MIIILLPSYANRPSSLEDYDDTIIPNPPSPVDFAAPSGCGMAELLGNNYVDRVDDAKLQCMSDLKANLEGEFRSFMDQLTETKGNFQNFLDQHSDELTEEEQEGLLEIL